MFPLLEVVQSCRSLLLPTVIVFRQRPVLTRESISRLRAVSLLLHRTRFLAAPPAEILEQKRDCTQSSSQSNPLAHQNMYCKSPSRNTRKLPNTSPQCRGNKTTLWLNDQQPVKVVKTLNDRQFYIFDKFRKIE